MRLASVLGFLTSLNVLLTFLYQWYVLITLGPGVETDALFAGMVIPQIVLAVVSGSLVNVLTPLLAAEADERFTREAWNFFHGLVFLFSGIALVLALTASFWVPWTVPGFDASSKLLTVSLARIQILGMIFTAVAAAMVSTYHARSSFIWASLSPVLAAVLALVFVLWGLPRFGVKAAAWGMVLRGVMMSICLMPGLGPYHKPSLVAGSFRKAWSRLRPLLLGTTYYKTDQLVDRFLASMAPPGTISLLNLATQIYGAGNQVIHAAIAAPMVPLLARKAHKGEWESFYALTRKRLFWGITVSCFGFVCLLVFGQYLMTILFAHGRFGSDEIPKLWWISVALVGVLIGGVMGQVLSTSFYAKGDTRSPTKIGVIGFTVGVFLKAAGFYLWGIIGIAIGTTLYYLLNAFWLRQALSGELHRLIGTTEQVE